MSKLTQFRTFHNVSFEHDGDLNSPIIRQIHCDLKVTALELELLAEYCRTYLAQLQLIYNNGDQCFNLNIAFRRVILLYNTKTKTLYDPPPLPLLYYMLLKKLLLEKTHTCQSFDETPAFSVKINIAVVYPLPKPKSGWPSGLRRCVQVAVWFSRRGFESHF